MSHRLGILLLICFQAFWFNVFLPGHTRGQIVMPGTADSTCTVTAAGGCCSAADEPDDPSSSKSRAGNCAVCAYAAALMTPAPVLLAPRPVDLLCLAPDPRVQSVTTLELVLAYLGRAPPLA